MSNLYDCFHKGIKYQKSVITNKNYTYRNLISFFLPYINQNKSILDIGCSVGTIDFFLSDKAKKIVGIDISKKAIEVAKKNSEILHVSDNVFFKVLKFPEQYIQKKFDLIICSEVLEHISNDSLALRIIYSSLKRNGTGIISIPSKNAPLYKLGFLKMFDMKVGHLRRYTLEELSDLMKQTDFKIIKRQKTEGVFRNLLFTFNVFSFLVKVANRFNLVSDILTEIDNLTLRLFGESNFYLAIKKE